MVLPVISASPAAPGAPAPKDDPAKVQDAAHQFEALLIGQMMKSMQNAEGGWLGTDEDDASASAMEYAQEMFAQSLAAGGGLGIAKLVAKGLIPPQKD
jgi:Rod binding domain-containing protein